MHQRRRRDYLDHVREAQDVVRQSKYLGDTFHDAAIAWGRLVFFVAIGLLLFLWPRIVPTDSTTLTGYTLTILYLMSPLEQILGWLPFLAWAVNSVRQIERLELALEEEASEIRNPTQNTRHCSAGEMTNDECRTPATDWQEIELAGATHSYRREGRGTREAGSGGFILGPIDATISRGQIVFIIGGNGSGKTTLAKLVAGLYLPESGEVRLDGHPVTTANREGYRQLFSVVFDNCTVFESLWGLGADGNVESRMPDAERPKPGHSACDIRRSELDERARSYLRQLELEHVVAVTDGVFSTTKLSRGQRKRLRTGDRLS